MVSRPWSVPSHPSTPMFRTCSRFAENALPAPCRAVSSRDLLPRYLDWMCVDACARRRAHRRVVQPREAACMLVAAFSRSCCCWSPTIMSITAYIYLPVRTAIIVQWHSSGRASAGRGARRRDGGRPPLATCAAGHVLMTVEPAPILGARYLLRN